jgi:Holliday junction resolvase RusA-like endonuclease
MENGKYKKAIQYALKPLGYTENPVAVVIIFKYRIPKSWTKKKKLDPPQHTSKPDIDNLIKSVMDAMNGIVYKDDGQVVSVYGVKMYGDNDEVVIKLSELKEDTVK